MGTKFFFGLAIVRRQEGAAHRRAKYASASVATAGRIDPEPTALGVWEEDQTRHHPPLVAPSPVVAADLGARSLDG